MAKLPNGSPMLVNTQLAFSLADDATAYAGSATQAMAYVLRLLHADYRRDGMKVSADADIAHNTQVASWADIAKGGEAQSEFVKAAKLSLGVAHAGADKNETIPQRAARQTNNAAERRHGQLIFNTIKFAAALEARGVPMENYVTLRSNGRELPMWKVPACFLVPEGWALLGAEAKDPMILRVLNGKSIVAQHQNDEGDWKAAANCKASVEQFKRAFYGAPAKAATPAPSNSITPTATPPVTLSNGEVRAGDFDKLIRAAAKLIGEWVEESDAPHPALSDLDNTTKLALEAVAAFYEDAKREDAKRVIAAQSIRDGATMHLIG